jgi:hypothetical protein
MSKIQQVEKAIVSGGGHQQSQSDIHGSSSNAIQEIDEEVRDYNDESLMEQGVPGARLTGRTIRGRRSDAGGYPTGRARADRLYRST